jgi:hypothetical protein
VHVRFARRTAGASHLTARKFDSMNASSTTMPNATRGVVKMRSDSPPAIPLVV